METNGCKVKGVEIKKFYQLGSKDKKIKTGKSVDKIVFILCAMLYTMQQFEKKVPCNITMIMLSVYAMSLSRGVISQFMTILHFEQTQSKTG